MSDSKSTKVEYKGLGFFSLLALIFITLKLTGHITWSWWWVLAPLWGPIAVVFAILVVILLVVVIGALWEKATQS